LFTAAYISRIYLFNCSLENANEFTPEGPVFSFATGNMLKRAAENFVSGMEIELQSKLVLRCTFIL
jgi:hypothetical protein